MTNKKLPLFIFPIGGRGDFLISILYGNLLKFDWNKNTIDCAVHNDQPLMGDYDPHLFRKFLKIHNFGMSTSDNATDIQPTNLNQYLTFKISIDTPEDLLEIAYFAWIKRVKKNMKLESVLVPEHGSTVTDAQWNQLRTVVCLTDGHVNEFNDYTFDYVISFSKLKDISFIGQLYTHINQRELTAEELERIQFNINHNEKLLKNNPFTVADVASCLSRSDKKN